MPDASLICARFLMSLSNHKDAKWHIFKQDIDKLQKNKKNTTNKNGMHPI